MCSWCVSCYSCSVCTPGVWCYSCSVCAPGVSTATLAVCVLLVCQLLLLQCVCSWCVNCYSCSVCTPGVSAMLSDSRRPSLTGPLSSSSNIALDSMSLSRILVTLSLSCKEEKHYLKMGANVQEYKPLFAQSKCFIVNFELYILL